MAHVGSGYLRIEDSVRCANKRMNKTLRMNNNFYFVRMDIKKSARFNYFQAFICQGCGIYCNLGAHRPGWMFERIFRFYVFQAVILPGSEWPAGSSQIVWNLASDRGTRVPNGTYLIRIQARAEDGQAVSTIRPLRVDRP